MPNEQNTPTPQPSPVDPNAQQFMMDAASGQYVGQDESGTQYVVSADGTPIGTVIGYTPENVAVYTPLAAVAAPAPAEQAAAVASVPTPVEQAVTEPNPAPAPVATAPVSAPTVAAPAPVNVVAAAQTIAAGVASSLPSKSVAEAPAKAEKKKKAASSIVTISLAGFGALTTTLLVLGYLGHLDHLLPSRQNTEPPMHAAAPLVPTEELLTLTDEQKLTVYKELLDAQLKAENTAFAGLNVPTDPKNYSSWKDAIRATVDAAQALREKDESDIIKKHSLKKRHVTQIREFGSTEGKWSLPSPDIVEGIGTMYYHNGLALLADANETNLLSAYYQFVVAADFGNSNAKVLADKLAIMMTPDQIADAKRTSELLQSVMRGEKLQPVPVVTEPVPVVEPVEEKEKEEPKKVTQKRWTTTTKATLLQSEPIAVDTIGGPYNVQPKWLKTNVQLQNMIPVEETIEEEPAEEITPAQSGGISAEVVPRLNKRAVREGEEWYGQ